MRIALVSTEVAGFRGGGIGTYVVEAADALTSAGHDVTLVTMWPEGGVKERERLRTHESFTRVVFVDELDVPPHSVRFAFGRRALWFAQLAREALSGSEEPFDYVEFPDYEAAGYVAILEHALLGEMPGTVFSVVHHSPTHECWQYNEMLHAMPPYIREAAVLEHETIRKAPVRWSPSRRLRQMVEDRLGLTGQDGHRPARIIRYPMRLQDYVPAPPPPRDRLEDLKFLYFGRIEPRKGVRQLVDAFAKMPELSIECVGRDNPSAPMGTSEIAYLRKRGASNVTFLDPLPRDELLQKLQEVDVVILPSVWENWPNTCIESMSLGRVVIGGADGGMGEMIEHGVSGFLCDGKDPEDIVRVVREELGGALGRLDSIGRAAADRIRELSDPARFVAAIEELVREAPARSRSQVRDEPLVTVVIPYYSEPRELVGEAVDSAIRQTWGNLEILIVNDGSPRDDATEILDEMAARDRRIRVLHKPNGGLSSARNFAIERARSDCEVFLFLDSDNRLREDYAECGMRAFASDPATRVVIPNMEAFDDRSGRKHAVVSPMPFDRALALYRPCLGDAGAMVHASVFRDHGLRYDSMVDVYSDWALWLDCATAGLKVQPLPRVLYEYRMRGDSMMGEQAWGAHLNLVGLLMQRHLPPSDLGAERDVLINMVHGWGIGALAACLGAQPRYSEDPVGSAEGFRPGRLRYRFADALANLPGARIVAHTVLGPLLKLHGRYKDWRRGNRDF